MNKHLLLLGAFLVFGFFGCKSTKSGPDGSSLRSTVRSGRVPTSNAADVITEAEAVEKAKQEATRRGRKEMRVMSCRFEDNQWVIGLEFAPYDELGNQSWVYVTTNGVIKSYIRGR